MSWDKIWNKRKKDKPNQLRKKPTIAFKSNLNQETLGFIKKLALQKEKSDFINQAIEQRYFLVTNRRQFLKQMIQEDYKLCKYLLRKTRNKN